MMQGFEPLAEMTVDARSCIDFGRANVHSRGRFLGSVNPPGERLLTVAASNLERELSLWENEQVQTSLMKGVDDCEH